MPRLEHERELLFHLLKEKVSTIHHGVNYNRFESLLRRHKIFPASEGLLPFLPDQQSTLFKQRLKEWTARSLGYLNELKSIKGLFENSQIKVYYLKGPVLSVLLYGTAHSRYYTDLDILLHPDNVINAVELLIKEGYILISPGKNLSKNEWKEYFLYNNDVVLLNSEKNVTIEIHLGIYVEQLLDKEKEDLLLSDSTEVMIQGQKFTTLATENNFLYLCFHGAKHMFFRLCWVRDIAAFLDTIPMDTKKVLSLARNLELEKSLSLALQMARYYCDSQLPPVFDDFVKKHNYPRLVKLAHAIISGPGELVYENFRKFRKVENQLEGINKVRYRDLFNQVLFLILLRKGFSRQLRFVLYQFRKRM